MSALASRPSLSRSADLSPNAVPGRGCRRKHGRPRWTASENTHGTGKADDDAAFLILANQTDAEKRERCFDFQAPPYVDLADSTDQLRRGPLRHFRIGVTVGFERVAVWLNGEPVPACIAADADEGWADVLTDWPLRGSYRCGESYLVRRYGRVQIRWVRE